MKKFLSLMLTLALIITTLALPITASAEDIALESPGNITVNYTLPTDSVHPGDIFDVTVKLTASAETTKTTVNGYVLDFDYDASKLVLQNETTDASSSDPEIKINTKAGGTDKFIRISSTTQKVLDETTKSIDVTTLKFKVAENVDVNSPYSFVLRSDNATRTSVSLYDTDTKETDGYRGSKILSKTAEETKVTFTANTYTIKKGDTSIENDKTYYGIKEAETYTIAGTNIETVNVKKGEEIIEASKGEDGKYTFTAEIPTVATTYTITVKVIGKDPVTTTFTITNEEVNVAIGIDDSINIPDTGLVPGAELTVPVSVTGVGGAIKAAMISFKVEYDNNVLELNTTDLDTNVTCSNGIFTYGDNNAGPEVLITENGKVFANLKFTVKNDLAAGFGEKSVKIVPKGLALAKDIDPGKDSIGVNTDIRYFVVVPTAAFAVAAPDSNVTTWTKDVYNVTINDVKDGAKVRYAVVNSETLNEEQKTQSGLATLYGTEENITGTTFKINQAGKYYAVIAMIGGEHAKVYQLITVDSKDTIKSLYDSVKPEVDDTAITVEGVKASDDAGFDFKLNGLLISKQEGLSIVNKLEYALSNTETIADDKWTNVDGFSKDNLANTNINLKDMNFNGKIYFRATDEAGNVSDNSAGVALKLDKDAPVITNIEKSSITAEGKYTLSSTVTDEGSNITGEALTAKWYKQEKTEGATVLDNVADIEALTDTGTLEIGESGAVSFDVLTDGIYYIVATDAAKHKAFKYIDVVVGKASVSALLVKVYANGEAKQGAFFATGDDKLAPFSDSNGTFMYVSPTVADAATGYKNEIALKKTVDGGEETSVDFTNGMSITDKGDYTLTIKTVSNSNANNYDTAVYKFKVVDSQAGMVSPSGVNYYDIVDYSMIMGIASKSTAEAKVLPGQGSKFSGIYAGDLNGNFEYDTEDYTAVINALRANDDIGTYKFNIMNGTATQGN